VDNYVDFVEKGLFNDIKADKIVVLE